MKPSEDTFSRMLSVLRAPETAVRAAYRVGSRVYGTAGPGSDEDFVAILSRPDQRQDLAFGAGINVVIHGLTTFQAALDDQSVFALECFFAAPKDVLRAPHPPFRFTLDKKKLARSAAEKSSSDWQKAKKRFLEEPEPSRKKLFHALRVPVFALEIATKGRLGDYAAANAHLDVIRRGPLDDFAYYEEKLGPAREALVAELSRLGGKR
jgi:hypothetical protein